MTHKTISCRRFLRFLCLILLIGILIFHPFCHFIAAQSVQTYRKPSESDLHWLFGSVPTSAPISSGGIQSEVLQTGYVGSRPTSSKPVGLPNPPIPPAPQVIDGIPLTGLAPSFDSSGGVVQMSGDRLPPPAYVPVEPQVLPPPLLNATAKPLQEPQIERLLHPEKYPFIVSENIELEKKEVLPCQPNEISEPAFAVPDMIGSIAWLSEGEIESDTFRATQPTPFLSVPNAAEHFNAEVQNRLWVDYRHWNNACSMTLLEPVKNYTQNRAVEQFSFGIEAKILKNLSVELSVPLIGQFDLAPASEYGATSAEWGNLSVLLKHVFMRKNRWTISGGIGTAVPTAGNVTFEQGELKNKMYHLVSFLGIQWHPNGESFGQIIVQTDLPINKNEWLLDSHRLDIEGQQVIRTGIQLGRWIYRNESGTKPCRLGSFAEINYASALEGTPDRRLNSGGKTLYIRGGNSRQSTLAVAAGLPIVIGKLTCTNSVILPISGSNKPFSVGYNFSLSQKF